MLKFIPFLVFASVLFGLFVFKPLNDNDFNSNSSAVYSPTPPTNSPKVKEINLSKDKIILPCLPETKTPEICSDDLTINVHTDAVDGDSNKLDYQYTINGGKIIGQGAKVIWDLSDTKPGSYNISVAVNDGRGFRSESKNIFIEVRECDECSYHCSCPTISVMGSSAPLIPGEIMTFTANVSGGGASEVKYNWTVKKGTIIRGQETPSIEVLPETPDSVVVATVEIGGLNEACGCANTASASSVTKEKK